MAARLTDKQKKKIVADYLETQSVNAAAQRNNVSWGTARKVLDEIGDIEQKLEEKKQENTDDILAYMESKRKAVCNIIELGLSVLPDKIEQARSATEVTTALGTLIDKFTAYKVTRWESSGDDDPITAALKEEAKRNALER